MSDLRVGHGYDIHRLQKGGRLILAGVEVSSEFSAIAHSDGDVVYHAVVDAILGALGAGDIGEHFPTSDPKWKNADSAVFVQTVAAKMREQRFEVVNLDVTILAEQPTLKSSKPAMVTNLQSHFPR